MIDGSVDVGLGHHAPAAARLSSRMDSASSTSEAVVTSGGMMRMTFT